VKPSAPKPAIESDAAESDAGWDLELLVASLRKARHGRSDRGDESRRFERPSRDAVLEIARGLRAALFPTHFGVSDFTEASVDFFVGGTLDAALCALSEQVRRSLLYAADHEHVAREHVASRARELVREFAQRLPEVRAVLESDILAAYQGDPAATGRAEVLFCYPGMTAITHHRLAHELYRLGVPLVPRMLSEVSHSNTGIDIHPGARIGESFFIDHGTGVVIGETAEIGRHVRLYQGVTLGARSFPLDANGLPIKGAPRHPIVEDDVVIYAGATILGRITVGRRSVIGGNVWLTRSVPPDSHVTQAKTQQHDGFDEGSGI
jgi:serine O-acetyltransferase